MNDTTRIRRCATAIDRSVGAEVLLATADRDEVDRLSETAAAVWHTLDVVRTRSEVAELMAGSFGQELRAVRADVDSLLDELVRRGWVEVVPG